MSNQSSPSSRSSLALLASKFDLPTGLLRAEQRLAERALRMWMDSDENEISGFGDHGLILVDPAGRVEISRISAEIARTFRLVPGQMLALDTGLAPNSLGAELCAACDLLILGGRPVPFEASLTSPGQGQILARGIALPIPDDRVQVVMSWREVLSRTAASRLRRELGAALESLSQGLLTRGDALPIGRQKPARGEGQGGEPGEPGACA